MMSRGKENIATDAQVFMPDVSDYAADPSATGFRDSCAGVGPHIGPILNMYRNE